MLMNKQSTVGPERGTIFKKIPRKRNFSTRNHNPYQENYMLEGESKQIGHIISSKNKINNTSIITFRFTKVPYENFNHKMMAAKKIDHTKKRNANKEIFLQNVRPIINHLNLGSIKVNSCEVRKLQNQICNKRSFKRINEEFKQIDSLQANRRRKHMRSTCNEANFISRMSATAKNSRMRMTSGSFRVKSHQNNYDLGMNCNSIELVDFLRKPNFKKDHFVFGLADKTDSLDNKMEAFRDFLWKINYSNALFVITPSQTTTSYKAFIGKGNNSIMVKGILRRRSWWTIVEDQSQANFVWTQLKVNSYFDTQPCRKMQFTLKDLYSQKQIQKLQPQPSTPSEEFDAYSKIFNLIDLKNWRSHYKRNIKTQQKICSSTYMKRVGLLNKKRLLKVDNPCGLKMQNHLVENYYIGNKKALFYNLKAYYQHIKQPLFQVVPLTFHIAKGTDDPKYAEFIQVYKNLQEDKKADKELKNIWIMKPGENTNRGNGITICFSLDQVQLRLKSKERNKDGTLRTFILQKYIERPLLFNFRKFDIRHYVLITSFGGSMRGYWYQQGYVRTSSSTYSLRNNKDLFVHLTNDAIQKNGDNYGKYQNGNKVSYEELERYILKHSKKQEKENPVSFFDTILPAMKKIALNTIRATYHLLDKSRKHHNFQLLGLDYMIDQRYNPFLIEVNTNPCLELSCPLLQNIIPQLIENVFKICIDPLFPPPEGIQISKKTFLFSESHIEDNKFELIFDQLCEAPSLKELFERKQDLGKIEQDQSQFQNDGAENWQQQNIND